MTKEDLLNKYELFYKLVPLVIGRDGKTYPEIALNKHSNLQINFPLRIYCGFEGLQIFNSSYLDYFVYSWKSKHYDYKNMLMKLIFNNEGITFQCEKYIGEYMPKHIFEYKFESIMKLKDFIQNQGKF